MTVDYQVLFFLKYIPSPTHTEYNYDKEVIQFANYMVSNVKVFKIDYEYFD